VLGGGQRQKFCVDRVKNIPWQNFGVGVGGGFSLSRPRLGEVGKKSGDSQEMQKGGFLGGKAVTIVSSGGWEATSKLNVRGATGKKRGSRGSFHREGEMPSGRKQVEKGQEILPGQEANFAKTRQGKRGGKSGRKGGNSKRGGGGVVSS